MDYRKRMSRFEHLLREKGLDSFLVTDQTNVSYLSGFGGTDSFILFAGKKRYFITDSRYIEEAKGSLKGFEFALVASTTYDTLRELVAANRLKKMGFEAMDLPCEVAVKLKALMKKTRLVRTKGLAEDLRLLKDEDEIEFIKKSVCLARDVFKKIRRLVRPGRTEESLSRLVDIEFIKSGARPAFDTIVAGGANSSKPHARPTARRIPDNSLVMVDIGCKLDGYNSDITRMVALGAVKDFMKKIYAIVADAQRKAFDAISPGAPMADVDRAARDYIEKKGFGRYFGHAVGHGVGMAVHEEPTISKNSQGCVRPGMVFTVEPAIYLPKVGGVRIEDMVLVTEDGFEILTR